MAVVVVGASIVVVAVIIIIDNDDGNDAMMLAMRSSTKMLAPRSSVERGGPHPRAESFFILATEDMSGQSGEKSPGRNFSIGIYCVERFRTAWKWPGVSSPL